MNTETKELVRQHVQAVMERLLIKRVITEPFLEEEINERNPFGSSVVPIEVWKGAKFERSFVTVLGQGIFEQLGRIIAEGTGAFASNQYDKNLTINTFRTETIDSIIKKQRAKPKKGEKKATPDLSQELTQLLSLDNEKYENVTVKSDLYIRREDGKEEYYSFKTVKPNLDQTAEAKKNLLLLKAGDPECEAYFALPYNPAGEGKLYTESKHSIPNKLFNMNDEDFVLVGSALWNKIGDDENTYAELLEIFQEVGQTSKERIQREYFGI
ncbi:TdeIII family type II restriction endonuclease [Cytobacillus firmus]|uniref:TdeIII family type II restriction endonuclease n=1 Tax=Cytobacillus firmus TaxID=1399 RepID=UPI0018CDA5A2|nr:TdeIII family type II restriction endonuclease [Cytobacillus firmus]MBG9657066.1 restriction endonuclease [Cytobacillus firmus]MED1906738.1 TdeIII family type II restriction endonuclease [Cytobacillus firmus]